MTSHPANTWALSREHAERPRAGFTLIELMAAMALFTILIVVVSRIFAITSTAIGSGQAMSRTLRGERAVGQVLSADFLGAGGKIGQAADQGYGMMPLVTGPGRTGAPFLIINNYRIAAYLSEADERPLATGTTETFAARSRRIRTMDLNGDGIADPATEVVPIYQYGARNFRCDTLGFFTRGQFASQAGGDVTSTEAFIWYGHLAEWQETGYALPGEVATRAATGGPHPNRNNLYAERFMLGRQQLLLVEPIDHDGNPGTPPTVVANNDPTRPIAFADRLWARVADRMTASHSPQPFTLDQPIVKFDGGTNKAINQTLRESRYDVLGVSATPMRDRVRALSAGAFNQVWTSDLPADWSDRFNFDLSRPQGLLAAHCSQLIVEFAGDFVTQDEPTGAYVAAVPDGTLDYILADGLRQIRWYGMPRDADRDGTLDVMPVRYFANGTPFPFERDDAGNANAHTDIVPPSANFLAERDEVGDSPDKSRYSCIWGPSEFETPVGPQGRYLVPQFIRIVVELRDGEGKLQFPVSEEFIYPVPGFR